MVSRGDADELRSRLAALEERLREQNARIEELSRSEQYYRSLLEALASPNPSAPAATQTLTSSSVLPITKDRDAASSVLQERDKLEVLGRAAGGIAHDFNNLLIVVLANAHVLRARHALPSATEIDAIVAAAERGAALARKLLSLSRRHVPHPSVVDINEVVSGIQGLLSRLLGAQISLVVELWPEPCCVWADFDQLEQVIMNLLVNAGDACGHSGHVRVCTELVASTGRTRVAAGSERANDVLPRVGYDVLLRVADSGRGMDGATQARIFEPFFTTKPKGQGSGLGLWMVNGIVTQSGGVISVQSRPGLGSEFELRFAAVRCAQSSAEANTNTRVSA